MAERPAKRKAQPHARTLDLRAHARTKPYKEGQKGRPHWRGAHKCQVHPRETCGKKPYRLAAQGQQPTLMPTPNELGVHRVHDTPPQNAAGKLQDSQVVLRARASPPATRCARTARSATKAAPPQRRKGGSPWRPHPHPCDQQRRRVERRRRQTHMSSTLHHRQADGREACNHATPCTPRHSPSARPSTT